MKFSTLDNINNFKNTKNKIPLENFALDKSQTSISINLSFLIDLNTLNRILICAPLLSSIKSLNKDSFFKYCNYFTNKNIDSYFFTNNLFLFNILFNIVTNKPNTFNNLSELAYNKAFSYAINNSSKSNLHNRGDFITLEFIPKIEFEAICITKYSYFYNAFYDKSVRKELNIHLKNNDFIDSLSANDKLFINTIVNKNIEVGYLENYTKLKNDHILQRELYMILQDYLILLAFLHDKNKTLESKIDILNIFFETKYFNLKTDIFMVEKSIVFYFDHLLFQLYEYIYKHFNLSSVSDLAAIPSSEIHESFSNINLDFKKYILDSIYS